MRLNRRQFIKTTVGLWIAAGVPLLLPKRAEAANWFADTFTAASDTALTDHAPDTGTSWTEYNRTGSNVVQILAAQDAASFPGTGSDEQGLKANGSPASDEFDVSILIASSGATYAGASFYFWARRTSSTSLYLLRWDRDVGGGTFTLQKYVSGKPETLGTPYALDLANSSHTIVWHIRNSDKHVYLDGGGSPIISSTDNSITGNGDSAFGFGVAGPTSYITFDDLTVADYSGGGPGPTVKHRSSIT